MRRRDERVFEAVARSRVSRSGWLRGNCPWCELRLGKADRKQCLGLHVITGKWHCFRCGTGGLVQELPDDFSPFREKVADPDAPRPVLGPPDGFYELFSGDGAGAVSLEPARRYVTRDRGITPALAREVGIGGCASGYYAGRVIVPVLGVDGDWRWWVGRAWTKKAEKPYTYPSGDREGVLFNPGALAVESDKPVLVVEGVFDAIAYWPDAVAVLGKPTEAHVEAFAAARRPVAIVLDGDAHDEGWALAMRLRFEGQRAGAVKLGPRIDPDEVDRDELRAEALRCLDAA
jgi:hypothetical protein